MKRDEFRQEVLESDICPQQFDSIYAEFCKFQDDALGTLREFHRICENSGIRYQLAFGSLLGAVRDHGQIPWDYDVDVFVPYEDRMKLVKALDENLPDRYYYYSPENNRKCRHYFMRVAPKEYKSTLLHVDVFYVIGAPEKDTDRQKLEKKMRCLFLWRYYKRVEFCDLQHTSWKRRLRIRGYKALLLPIPMCVLDKAMDKLCSDIPFDKSGICIPVITVYKNMMFDTKELWDTVLLETDEGTFRVPRCYDAVLTKIYKDYRRIFPLESRLREMLNSYEHISGKKVSWSVKQSISERYYTNEDH